MKGEDLLIDKSRDMGATWITLGAFFLMWLFVPDSHFLVASRKEEYVDRRGDHKCLFEKLLYMYERLPDWLKPPMEKTKMHLRNAHNGSCIDGEATSPNLGAGDRRLGVLLDEFARVDPNVALAISETLSDTTDCIIYNSTHTSMAHPYARLRYSDRVKHIILPWWERPERAVGLYRSPAINKVICDDLKYYQKKYGGAFNDIKDGEAFNPSNFEIENLFGGGRHGLFTADGNGGYRSVWYDKESRRRSSRDLAQNIDMNPIGSGDMLFDAKVLQRIRSEYCKQPDLIGEVRYDMVNGRNVEGYWEGDNVKNATFMPESGRKRLHWWGELFNGRPEQEHSYTVGCDISLGAGNSNSTVCIYDNNTNEKVGRWVCAMTPPTEFANQVVAICKWVGGGHLGIPYLIWETNGVGGVFTKRIKALGYGHCYVRRKEDSHLRTRGKEIGWYSNQNTKMDLLIKYREALALVYLEDTTKTKFITYDEDAVSEAESYIFISANAVAPASFQSDDAGARATHGDIVISEALCCLARDDVTSFYQEETEDIPEESYFARRKDYDFKQNQIDNNGW